MDKKKLIAASLGGVVLIGAGAYMYLQSGQDIGTTQTNGTGQASSELGTGSGYDESGESGKMNESGKMGLIEEEEEITGEELEALFEGVYIASMESVRENPPKNKETQIAYEFNQLEAECEQGKKLPSDYKVQYREWRENYKLSDLSILFTDVMQEMYIINSAYTYADIYKDSKLSLLVGGEEVYVTGIGFDKADGWLRCEGDLGEVYIESENVSEEQFMLVSEVRYAKGTTNLYMKADTSSTILRSIIRNKEVVVIGVGFGEYDGWLKLEIEAMGVKYIGYARSEDFNESKSNNSSSQKDNGNQQDGQKDSGDSKEDNAGSNSGSGGQQDNNGSGGDQGSNNSGGNSSGQSDTGDYWQDHYGMTAEELRNLSDEELIALGFTQYPDGTWVDEDYMMLPTEELSEEGKEAANESSEGVNWYG